MMAKKALWHGLTVVCGITLGLSVTVSQVLEAYRGDIDKELGTQSEIVVSEDGDNLYKTFMPDAKFYDPATGKTDSKALIQRAIDLGRQEGEEGCVLLKNEGQALPITGTKPKVTLFGIRSNVPLLGSSFGVKVQGPCITLEQALTQNKTDFAHTIASQIPSRGGWQTTQSDPWTGDEFDFDGAGFDVNPTMMQAYAKIAESQTWAHNEGAKKEYDPKEPAISELGNAVDSIKGGYEETGIVVISRPGGESNDYLPGSVAAGTGAEEPLALTTNERELIKLAKEKCKKVIVLINCTSAMEIDELKEDKDIDAIMWIGFPGSYGMLGVADVLSGKKAPSGHLYDIYATYNMSAPAMQNMGDFKFSNADDITRSRSKTYIIEAEGLYVGYRYYETRYYDAIYGQGNAASSAGVYGSKGNWSYADEVTYGFGYGLSYTDFKQELVGRPVITKNSHEITMDFKVKVTNTGDIAGKEAVQIYGKAPWSKGMVEKSAIQLLAFGKTGIIEPGKSEEVTVTVDLQDLASYDSTFTNPDGTKGTYVFDSGDYYFAIGNGAHDALNNVLAAEGKTTADGMDYNGNAAATFKWNYNYQGGKQDTDTFAFSKTGQRISNHIEYGDWNFYEPNAVTYLSRSNWSGTWPKTYSNMKAPDSMMNDLNGHYYTIKQGEDTSSIKWNSKDTNIQLYEMVGAEYDDYRWDSILSQLTVEESMYIAGYGGPTIPAVPSIGLGEYYMTENCGNGMVLRLDKTVDTNAPWSLHEDKNHQWNPQVFAASPNLASSFNHDLMYDLGVFVGEEALFDGLPILWGPGLNTHRHAYNGRNCEYYSEDPVLSGVCAMEFAIGARSKGLIAAPKHFAFNDQETNRNGVAPFMTEQRAREVELRAFQIAFEANKYDTAEKDLGMFGLMTSFSKIGAVEVTCSRGLLTDILRNEWGFHGYAVTDIFDDTDLYTAAVYAGITGFDIRGASNFYEKTTLASRFGKEVDGVAIAPGIYDGDLAMNQALRQSNHDFLWGLAQSNLMNRFNASTHKVWNMTWWRATYIAAISVTAVLTLGAAVMFVLETRKEGN